MPAEANMKEEVLRRIHGWLKKRSEQKDIEQGRESVPLEDMVRGRKELWGDKNDWGVDIKLDPRYLFPKTAPITTQNMAEFPKNSHVIGDTNLA